jgi:hypothetical protein
VRKETSMGTIPGDDQELSSERRQRLEVVVRGLKFLGSSRFDPNAFAQKLAEDGRLSPDDVHRAAVWMERFAELYERELKAQSGTGTTPADHLSRG